ncbi:hypothetical protein [Paraburkholderia sp.]|uniref:hypothetical protein n=1 Tax=Paraburkholderia sp. TaxID=1926495 RepID=UPI0023918D73|nr:hypothetical protein [Paraburkholderia sp.]MDE1181583.1 hypothetical protein [Paraburkholderia sp.]
MVRSGLRSVMAVLYGKTLSAEYSDLTGQLCVRHDGVVIREWFPPHSWIAIASAAGARNWGTRPDDEELLALLQNEALSIHA